ncbi:DNA-directed RNA polymerase II subunit E [Invertebrate iridescent virus 30]|uniref:DNA-directed RNA polymerase II subunit E n=1 Tax=Invertebrate iridescent virus 30 TaxID=345585 RepID=W8W279_9VIRU|nr:DNA-directed RNA polymerase II subunit E [Invertebrate iridescent virus 30]CCV02361.1 DNA-directed RNA polymerase II subunit E [Invertebrate iridescent virus 30]
MEPYFKEKYFIEEIVLLPKYLNLNLTDTIKNILKEKYPKTYLNHGYIFNIRNIEILDNKITLSDQIVIKVKFKVDIYVPEINHIFQGELKKGSINKFKWVEIGPLTIFINDTTKIDKTLVKVQIINIKSDNTLCFGKII